MTTFFLHENIYRDLSRVADEQITICGAGALGANLTETLARMGMRHLRVIDRDRVEAHNLSTQPWHTQDVGTPKARVLANMLYRAVGARIEPKHTELTSSNAAALLQGSAVVVDTFDNLPSRQAVASTTQALGIPCLHPALGTAGDYGCVLWDDAYTRTLAQGQVAATEAGGAGCDYPLTRPLALLLVATAAELLLRYLLDGSRQGCEITLHDLCITRHDILPGEQEE